MALRIPILGIFALISLAFASGLFLKSVAQVIGRIICGALFGI